MNSDQKVLLDKLELRDGRGNVFWMLKFFNISSGEIENIKVYEKKGTYKLLGLKHAE